MNGGWVGGLRGWGVRETEKGTTVLCSVKNKFPHFTNKRAAAHTPLQYFRKVCQAYGTTILACKHTITTSSNAV